MKEFSWEELDEFLEELEDMPPVVPIPQRPPLYVITKASDWVNYYEAVARRLYNEIRDDHNGTHDHCLYCAAIREVDASGWSEEKEKKETNSP